MNFKSQIATTHEQSERLLALGLKLETADIYLEKCRLPEAGDYYLHALTKDINPEQWFSARMNRDIVPAWSLSRLLEMMPPFLNKYGALYLHAGLHTERYNKDNRDIAHKYDIQYGIGSTTERYESPFEAIVEAIEWLIANGYFNKDYLK